MHLRLIRLSEGHHQRRMLTLNNAHFWALLKKYGVHHRITTPYHTQENGLVEVSNREVKNSLKKIIRPDGNDWHTSFPMHYGHTVRHTRHPSGCLPSILSLRKPTTFRLSLSIEPIGLSKSSIYLWMKQGNNNFSSSRSCKS